MRVRRRLAAVLVAGLAASGAAVATAAGAQASTSDCASTYTCWWVDTGYSGTYYGSAMNQLSWPSGIANKDSSVWNDGTSGQAIFTYNYNANIEVMYCVRKGVKVSSIPSSKANRGNSHNWKAPDSGCL
ncbi:hypothetical protein KDY119_03752 [Luteimicrobium xylanilyticum]|uniref:Peptidase inhibitor family I36 n=1 Tax=Luteimicrobium xylanilyticum TaxID=1133546 RepID=A0A5P9QG54_9MICO|nr:peptidase inhibitor family I36 protein [Luteimicrobium xylanilyticum]QFV00217.1 hypothetical protein KDY119_03752 [Luteimicrobium xylanilyticum]